MTNLGQTTLLHGGRYDLTDEEAYDLAKREESNLSIKRTFVDYKLQDEKDKEAYKKNKGVELQGK